MIQCLAREKFAASFAEGRLPRLVGVSKVDADVLRRHPRVLHKHAAYLEIVLIRSGIGSYIVDETRYEVRRGDLIICDADVLHDEEPEKNFDLALYCCTLTGVSVVGRRENGLLLPGQKPVLPIGAWFAPIEQIFFMMFSLLAERTAARCDEICTYLAAALTATVVEALQAQSSAAPESGRMDYLIARAKRFIDEHYSAPLFLEQIAAALSLNPYYLSHIFKEGTGYSLMQYVIRRRIGEAQSLLIETGFSVTEIAGRCGFSNSSHFNVQFSKYVGMPPSRYRQFYRRPNTPNAE